jgi:hypothetical protein
MMRAQKPDRPEEVSPGSPSGAVPGENRDAQTEVERLTSALKDIVALAHSAGDSRSRAVLMLRRATAALAGKDRDYPDAPFERR